MSELSVNQFLDQLRSHPSVPPKIDSTKLTEEVSHIGDQLTDMLRSDLKGMSTGNSAALRRAELLVSELDTLRAKHENLRNAPDQVEQYVSSSAILAAISQVGKSGEFLRVEYRDASRDATTVLQRLGSAFKTSHIQIFCGKEEKPVLDLKMKGVTALTLSQDASLLAIASNGSVGVYRVKDCIMNGKLEPIKEVKFFSGPVLGSLSSKFLNEGIPGGFFIFGKSFGRTTALAFTPDNDQLVIANAEGYFWNASLKILKIAGEADGKTAALKDTVLDNDTINPVSTLAFHKDGKLLAVGGSQGTIDLYRSSKENLVGEKLVDSYYPDLSDFGSAFKSITTIAFHDDKFIYANEHGYFGEASVDLSAQKPVPSEITPSTHGSTGGKWSFVLAATYDAVGKRHLVTH